MAITLDFVNDTFAALQESYPLVARQSADSPEIVAIRELIEKFFLVANDQIRPQFAL